VITASRGRRGGAERARRAWEALGQDLRYGLRQLAKHPGFSTAAALTLALGIGANTAIFSVLDAALLRPLPFPGAARLVAVSLEAPGAPAPARFVVPAASFAAWRERSASLAAVAGYDNHLCDSNLSGGPAPERIQCGEVSAGLLGLLGTPPARGREFTAAEERPGGARVALVSDGLWRRRFGASSGAALPAAGRTVVLDGLAYEVVGVLPAGFQFLDDFSPDVLLPLPAAALAAAPREPTAIHAVARLRPGRTAAQAAAELLAIQREVDRTLPRRLAQALAGAQVRLVPLARAQVEAVRGNLLVLAGAVALVLLIAAANVTSLLLVRALARRHEVAVRVALGAPRRRLVRQLLTEGLLLAALGGAAALLVAAAALAALRWLGPDWLPRLGGGGLRLAPAALAFNAGAALLTGVLTSLAPVLMASRTGVASFAFGAAAGAGGAGAGRAGLGLRRLFVAAELALSFALLIGAGLLLRSFARLLAVDPGFAIDDVLTVQVTLSETAYREPERQVRFFDQLLQGVAALPGVRSAAATTDLPLTGSLGAAEVAVAGGGEPSAGGLPRAADGQPGGPPPLAALCAISPGYLRTLGITLQAGRDLTAADGAAAPRVALVNRAFVRRFLPAREPLGQRIVLREPGTATAARELAIVGVIADFKQQSLDQVAAPEVLTSYRQFPAPYMTLAVRPAAGPAWALRDAVRRAVLAVDPGQPIYHATTVAQRWSRALARQRFNLALLGAFAGLALLLAAVGVYGVTAYSVRQQTHALGLRMALGAMRGDVLRLVLGQGLRLALAGLAGGVVTALALSRFLAGLVYGLTPKDPITFGAVAALFLATALAATFLPARRATRLDPTAALRAER
jgi:putative ABC transport system permease protein